MPAGLTFSEDQLHLILDAVEDYAVLLDEDKADKCGEILDIIEAHLIHTSKWKFFSLLSSVS